MAVKYPRRSKYGNQKVRADVYKFDSKKEYARYCELKIMQKAHEIYDLKLQVPFELQPKFKNLETGKTERAIKYIADFTYYDKNGNYVVEDVKSEATRKKEVYQLKRKMMAYMGYYIQET